jgi:2-dehydro-3-deoxyglucarate aldolase
MNRKKKIHEIRQALADDLPSIGSWIQIPHASLAEIIGQAGYDWVAVDMEHGSISVHQLPDLFRALELGGTLPLVRLARGHTKDCKQALDAGAGGVIVPMVESAAQLLEVRDACRWPPAGNRGVGFSRANLFGKHFDTYRAEAQAPILVAMIEHVRAVDDLEGILAVEGLDAILVGPYDLSASMGIVAEFESQDFVSVMDRIRRLCAKHNVPYGVHVVQPDPLVLQQKIAEGCRFIAYSLDSVFFNHAVLNPLRTLA